MKELARSYIDRAKFLEEYKELSLADFNDPPYIDGWNGFRQMLEDYQADYFDPPRCGKWLYIELVGGIDGHTEGECSVCHRVRIVDKFCPNCGAQMAPVLGASE